MESDREGAAAQNKAAETRLLPGAGHFPTMRILAPLPENKLAPSRRLVRFSGGHCAAMAWYPKNRQCAREKHSLGGPNVCDLQMSQAG
jgi:hypothetical protein